LVDFRPSELLQMAADQILLLGFDQIDNSGGVAWWIHFGGDVFGKIFLLNNDVDVEVIGAPPQSKVVAEHAGNLCIGNDLLDNVPELKHQILAEECEIRRKISRGVPPGSDNDVRAALFAVDNREEMRRLKNDAVFFVIET
jgi:hypothetical protein